MLLILFSLNGGKDSEICAVIFDEVKSKDLLRKLINEHTEYADPINDFVTFFRCMQLRHCDPVTYFIYLATWKTIAKENTEIYVRVFKTAIPDGEPSTFKVYPLFPSLFPFFFFFFYQ